MWCVYLLINILIETKVDKCFLIKYTPLFIGKKILIIFSKYATMWNQKEEREGELKEKKGNKKKEWNERKEKTKMIWRNWLGSKIFLSYLYLAISKQTKETLEVLTSLLVQVIQFLIYNI